MILDKTFSLSYILCSILSALFIAQSTYAQTPALPDERPAKIQPTYDGFEYVRRDVMIPMRDGVKLHTVILIPNGAKNAPILLTRTPYDATATHNPREQFASRSNPDRLRQCHRCHC